MSFTSNRWINLASIALCLGLIVSFTTPTRATDDVVKAKRKVENFDLQQVRLLPSPFKTAQDKNSEYLLSVDVDRLLSRIRENAGLKPRAPKYGGWESQTIAGHSLGHYLSAVSKNYAATGDPRFKERAEYIAAELAECQDALGSGLVMGDPRYVEVFQQISKGDVRSQGFDLNGLWVPWYALHKIFAGLLDAYHYCDCQQALEDAKRLGDWTVETTKNLTFDQFQVMLRCEYGGTNDAFYSLYAATGDEKYLQTGDRFYDLAILKPLSEGRDELQGRHGNTQIPKLVGLARRYEVAGNGDVNAFPTANFFWDRVVHHHSYAIGGHSLNEHFGAPDMLSDRITGSTCETCNTYNMLKLTKELYMQSGDVEYVNFFERALYNHILASIDKSADPSKLFTYFVPLGMGQFRTYSTPENNWTCCHGTGMENHTQYNGHIYYHETLEDGREILYVNLLIPSKLNWEEKGLTVSLDADGNLTIDAKDDASVCVKVRVPNNCQIQGDRPVENGYCTLGDSWAKGESSIKLDVVANWKLEPTPDDPELAAFFRGPVMYAGDVGSVDKKLATQLDVNASDASNDAIVLPVVVSDSRQPNDLIDARQGSFFETPDKVNLTQAKPEPIALVPFYAATQRYCAYFNFFTNEAWAEKEKEFQAERARIAKIAQATIYYFQPGEMQPERDVNFNGEKSSFGTHMGRKWRDARDGGSFEFDMKVDPDKDCSLVITYWGDEVGNRVFDILADGKKLAERRLDRDAPGKFFDEAYALPNPEKKSTIRVKFQGRPGAWAGGIFGARTIATDDLNVLSL